jgi:Ser/Thr protein kinase RdoA (MazF antagonist)
MMKLKHLFDNRDLAEMLLKNWEYDADSPELFQYYRISANAIYPFRMNGNTCYLRFCPVDEKSEKSVQGELEFIHYLRSQGFHALEPIQSRSGDEVIRRSTPWGEYLASAFKRVHGEQVSELDYNDQIVAACGTALGELHGLSAEFTNPKTRRWTHKDALNWIGTTLSGLQVNPAALEEARILGDALAAPPVGPETYGLIHYDFEPDNIFFDEETGKTSVIDFDDCMVHWYVMDILQALDSFEREIPVEEFPHKRDVFLDGYRSRFPIDERLLRAAPIFNRFANLYRYARIARSIEERWENEPEWMVELRSKLDSLQRASSECFGTAVKTP